MERKEQDIAEEAALIELKSKIGFGTAFKATLGFYLGQMVAQTLGLILFAGIAGSVILGLFWLTHR